MTEGAYTVARTEAEGFKTPQQEDVTVLARGDEPGGDFDVLYFRIPTDPGAVPMHIHHENDEGFYVLSGELLFQIDDQRQTVTEGTFVSGARGVPHGYRNVGEEDAHVLVMYSPGTFVEMSEDLAGLGKLDLDNDEDMQKAANVLEAYGIELIGPPPETD